GGRIRRAGHRWAAGLRARRRSGGTRVLRGDLLVLRQPGPGSVQAAHGPAGLLLGLLPPGQAGLRSADHQRSARSRDPRPTPRSPERPGTPTGAFEIPPPGLRVFALVAVAHVKTSGTGDPGEFRRMRGTRATHERRFGPGAFLRGGQPRMRT